MELTIDKIKGKIQMLIAEGEKIEQEIAIDRYRSLAVGDLLLVYFFNGDYLAVYIKNSNEISDWGFEVGKLKITEKAMIELVRFTEKELIIKFFSE